jgi:hypothetical protein
VIVALPPLLFFTLIGIFVVGVASLLNPIVAGDMTIALAPVVITSAITPDPGSGSCVSVLPLIVSEDLLALSV